MSKSVRYFDAKPSRKKRDTPVEVSADDACAQAITRQLTERWVSGKITFREFKSHLNTHGIKKW